MSLEHALVLTTAEAASHYLAIPKEANFRAISIVRDARIELAPQPWEGRILPLN